jgi:hypothetical protein
VFPSAVKCFADDFKACIAHLRMPASHGSSVRTTEEMDKEFFGVCCAIAEEFVLLADAVPRIAVHYAKCQRWTRGVGSGFPRSG